MSDITCSFCGKNKDDAAMIISGLDAHICDECVPKAQQLIDAELNTTPKKSATAKFKLIKPAEMKRFLDEYVIGQEEAKKVLSVAVYNHYKRLMQRPESKEDDIVIEKSNIVMVGETGTGKTYLAKNLAKLLEVPFCIADATVLTEAGYVGEDVETVITRLLQASDYDTEAAERGIVYIDEIDKISRKGDNPSITRDVSGEGVQQSLLKLLEGTIANVAPQGGRKHPDQKYLQVNTENILFICGGAFDGIDKIIANRLNTRPVGFSRNDEHEARISGESLLQYVSAEDLKSFGLIPELIGRMPVLTHLDPLDQAALKRILTEPKNALVKQYKKLFEMENIKLDFEEEALDFIVEKAASFKLGARGLRSICEAVMTDAMFNLPSEKGIKNFTLTRKAAEDKFGKSVLSKLKAA